MRAVDANVLVRLIARDDPARADAAASFIAPGAWVPLLALAEAVWALDSVYGLPPRRIAAAIEVLLNHESLSLQDADAVAAALAHFRRRPALKFSDCLMLATARKAGHEPLGTFDRALGRLEGVQRL